MKRRFFCFITIVTIIIAVSSCFYDNEEALYPTLNSTCDTTNVTYSGKVVPILQNNCLSCHSNAMAPSAGNNIALETYADVSSRADVISASINQTGTHSPMPKNGGKLKACLISTFDIWIRIGKPNN
jgi:uncharacterized membrane protein